MNPSDRHEPESPHWLRAQVLELRRQVAELRRAEARLQRAEEELSRRRGGAYTLADTGELLWWDTDLVADQGRISPGLYELLGRSPPPGPLPYRQALELVHPADREPLQRALGEHLAGRSRTYRAEFRMAKADGGWVWLVALGRVMSHTPQGRPRRFIGFLRDVTAERAALAGMLEDRRRAREQASRASGRYRLAAGMAGLATWRWELADGRVRVDPELVRRLGLEPGAGEWDSLEAWLELIHPQDREPALAAARRCARGEEAWFEVAYRFDPPGGERRWFLTRGQAERDAAGEIVALAGVTWDVTALRRAEEALAAKESQLTGQAASLADANTALEVLLAKRRQDLQSHKARTRQDLERLLLPYLELLGQAELGPREANLVAILRRHLAELLGPPASGAEALAALSPAERQVAELVRQGRTSREIGGVLGVSPSAVQFHRDSIRRKLGLKHSRRNLRLHLQRLLGAPRA